MTVLDILLSDKEVGKDSCHAQHGGKRHVLLKSSEAKPGSMEDPPNECQSEAFLVARRGLEANDGISAKPGGQFALREHMGAPAWLTNTFLEPGGVGRGTIAALMFLSTPLARLGCIVIMKLPWTFKSAVCTTFLKLWVALHRRLPAVIARRAIADEVSIETHAMHNIMWWARLLPVKMWQMRFGLSQLSIPYPPQCPAEWVNSEHVPSLSSAYLRLCPPSDRPPRVLFWVFGGAYVSGDVEGNLGPAEHYGRNMGCDVFVVDMRLCPEHTVQDAVLDLYRGYQWLLKRVPPENVMMLGISSGGGSIVRALQLACDDDAGRQRYWGEGRGPLPPALPQPAGAILLGAFVRYTEIYGSMVSNAKYDWIVSPRVLEGIEPYRARMSDGLEKAELCSPISQSMAGLCPLFVSVSEHEGLIDENLELAAKARAAGVNVELSTRPYQCHVYQMFSRYLPEAAEEESKVWQWVKSKGGAWA